MRIPIRMRICIGYVSARYVSDTNAYSYRNMYRIRIVTIRIRCECLFVLGYTSDTYRSDTSTYPRRMLIRIGISIQYVSGYVSDTYRNMYLIHIGTIRTSGDTKLSDNDPIGIRWIHRISPGIRWHPMAYFFYKTHPGALKQSVQSWVGVGENLKHPPKPCCPFL